ncbi:MAG TPA: DNA methyltransferase [Magnetospirillaceae bacterium]|jgi:hypothetical protein
MSNELNEQLKADKFITRWSGREGGQERANYALFLTELCDVLGLDHPEPAGASHDLNDYVFERRIEREKPEGGKEVRLIDLYKRDCFILEAKQSRLKGGKKAGPAGQGDLFASEVRDTKHTVGSLDHLMINARRQAETYAQILPSDHAYPPFILVADVGRAIEVYADFSGHGRHYSQFPSAIDSRIELSQLADVQIRDRLRKIWDEPTTLDPAKQTAKVTREIAEQLAELSKVLEGRGLPAGQVAIFLMRCLFTMFVEDVELIEKDSFKKLLDRCLAKPESFPFEMNDLWRNMDVGEYSPAIGAKLLRFNGKLFKKADAIKLEKDEIALLAKAAAADWRDLDPAIFGTLFEQALDPKERRRLGAHYTPRIYVERLVDATIMEPLRNDWIAVQASAELALRFGRSSQAITDIAEFLKKLSTVRVLDPACGTGNFLYVALRRMKQLEGEALKQLKDVGGDEAINRMKKVSVQPEQFFGMEINRRAVEIAELVLWIGYLQWHLRTRNTKPEEPVLGSSDHVQELNALMTWSGYPVPALKRDRAGKPIAQNGNEIYVYPNASQPDWPEADFIVGNPPFTGGKDVRGRSQIGYAEALWKVHPLVKPSSDYVMYWWQRAAELLIQKKSRLRSFGFVTTKSITQVRQRGVVEHYLKSKTPVSIVMAIPNHPWTKATKDAAAVRIAMTVVVPGTQEGRLYKVTKEEKLDSDEPQIAFSQQTGTIHADLTIGTNVTKAKNLLSNEGLCSPGVKLHGDGFIVDIGTARKLGFDQSPHVQKHIREYRNGRDLASHPREVMVIDLYGLNEQQVRKQLPEIYQHLRDTVKPEREKQFRKSPTKDARSYLEKWWLMGKPRTELRPALEGLSRYIATIETAKHRTFQFLPSAVLPDNMLVVIASNDAFHLGVLSSHIHMLWALRSGGRQGVGNDPRYSKSRCFDPFPFPQASKVLAKKIGALAEELDETRKLVLHKHPDLTLTKLYNVLEEVRAEKPLSTTSQDVKDRGLILILKDLHEQIDIAVADAYGWAANLTDDEVLEKLVALNADRSAHERRGFVRWLRPDYQTKKYAPLTHKAERVQSIVDVDVIKKQDFPDNGKDRAREVLDLLSRSKRSMSIAEIAATFAGGKRVTKDVGEIVQSLHRLGEADTTDNGRSYSRTAS